MADTCSTCRWSSYPFNYHHDDRHETLPIKYACKRRSPTATGGMMSAAWTMWPEVSADDWCGEHRPAETGET